MKSIDLVLFDRDNTLVNDNRGYTYKVEDLEWMPTAKSAVIWCKRQGFRVAVITNQSGIARGFYSLSEVEAFHLAMNNDLPKETQIDKFYVCPHHPNGIVLSLAVECECRKPETLLFKLAFEDFRTNPENSIFFGDSETDMIAGRKAGVASIQVQSLLFDLVLRELSR